MCEEFKEVASLFETGVKSWIALQHATVLFSICEINIVQNMSLSIQLTLLVSLCQRSQKEDITRVGLGHKSQGQGFEVFFYSVGPGFALCL